MGPPSYMRSVVDRNVVMRRIPVSLYEAWVCSLSCLLRTWRPTVFATRLLLASLRVCARKEDAMLAYNLKKVFMVLC